MSKFELRILQSVGYSDRLQYRTKDVWPYDTVPSLDNRDPVWSRWKDVPRVCEG